MWYILKMRYFIFFGIFTQFLLAPLSILAHGINYLEFNPDNSSLLKVSEVATPAQVFFVQNDFLGGVNLWIANPGSSGTVTFDLLNDQGVVLRSQTITVPTIAETSNGTKFHIDFSSQAAVKSSSKYSVRVISSIPELRLYYSERVQLVAHNAPFVSEYVTGVGKLGSEEQSFSFKYALYETTESVAPVISNISWTVVSENQMRVDFNANEPIDYLVEYGLFGQGYTQSINFTGEYHLCAPTIAFCGIAIPVSSGATYQYRLTVKDSWGNQGQVTGTFESGQSQIPTSTPTPTPSTGSTSLPQASLGPSAVPSSTTSPVSSPTLAPTDNTPPVISNLRIVSLTEKSVEIAWTTNEVANSHLLISTPFFITITDASDPTMELEHLLKINNGLGSNVAYVATVTSIDLGSNESKDSINFTTLPPIVIANPSPPSSQQSNQTNQLSQNPLSQVTTSSPGSGGYIQWVEFLGGEPSSGYRVDVFDKKGNLVETVMVPVGSSSAKISNLEDGEYSVIVYANKGGVFEKIDQPVSLEVDTSFIARFIDFWPYLLVVVVLAGFLYWTRKRQSYQITKS